MAAGMQRSIRELNIWAAVHPRGLSPSQPPTPFTRGTSQKMQRLFPVEQQLPAPPGASPALEQELWAGTRWLSLAAAIKPILFFLHKRRKASKIPPNFPTPRRFPSRPWGWRMLLSPRSSLGLLGSSPWVPLQLGSIPTTARRENSPSDRGMSLCREKEVCAPCLRCPFGTEAVTTRTLTRAQPPERAEIKLLL